MRCTEESGVIFQPEPKLGLEFFVDADFVGCWSQADADNPENVMYHTGYIISYSVCPIGWCSKLQTYIFFSIVDAEYIALSQALRTVIPLMTTVEELSDIFPLDMNKPDYHCKVFEENQSCIAVTESSKFSPQKKHIFLKYHHFKYYIDPKQLRIIYTRFRRSAC